MGHSHKDLTVTRGRYRHITLAAAADLTGYAAMTIRNWAHAGAVAYTWVRTSPRRRMLMVVEADVVQVASMTVAELHEMGIVLRSDRRRQYQRRWAEAQRMTTYPEATRHYQPWEATELALVADLGMPLVEVAKRLGRTYAACLIQRCHMVEKHGGHVGARPAEGDDDDET